MLRTTYHGHYDGLGNAWGEFLERASKTDHKLGDGFWESYAVGPESGPDPKNWRTELNRTLAG